MTGKKRTVLAVGIILAMIFLAAFSGFASVLLTDMIAYYGLTNSAKGLNSTASSIGGIVALSGSFFLLGRLSKTKLLCMIMGLSSIALMLVKVAPAFSVFFGIMVILGVCTSLIDSLTSSCMANLYQGSAGTRMMSALHMIYSVACVIYPVIYNGMLNKGIAWNSIYLYVGLFGILILIYLVFAVRYAKESGQETVVKERKLSGKEMVQAIRTSSLAGMVLVMFCNGFYMNGISWINRYISEDLNSNLGGIAISFVFFGVTVSRLLTTFFAISAEKYVKVGGLTAGLFILIALPVKNPMLMCVAICLAGLAYGAMIPCIMSIACSRLPENTMLVTTVLGLCSYAATGISGPVMGAMESFFGLGSGIALSAGFMVATSLSCMVVLRKKNR